jgi:RHS repeat-associated protein
VDATGKSPDYEYDAAGRLWKRLWMRTVSGTRVTTTYAYNRLGEIRNLTYSDGTLPVTLTRNNLGQITTVADARGTHTLAYNEGELSQDLLANGDGVELAFDRELGTASYELKIDNFSMTSGGWSRNLDTGLIDTVMTAAGNVNYSRLPGGDFLSGHERGLHRTTRTPDAENRLATIGTSHNSVDKTRYTYHYDAGGQRDRATLLDGSYWSYGYNARGEVTSGNHHLGDSRLLPGRHHNYTFDAIGNRTEATANLQNTDYTPNALNQYGKREAPGFVQIQGEADPTATLTVNEVLATRRPPSRYFSAEFPVNNTAGAVWQSVNVLAVMKGAGTAADAISPQPGHVFVAPREEFFEHDDDGNLTLDGRWIYRWDAENRLREMETRPTLSAAVPRILLRFSYDSWGRRFAKKVFQGSGGSYPATPAQHTEYHYLGWNLIAEWDAATYTGLIRTYQWGLDLSGSFEGAGGVGGLLNVSTHEPFWGPRTDYTPCYDGNGNIVALLDGSGQLDAEYAYGPFGEPLRATGAMAAINPFRLSTKYQDQETGLLNYTFRYYDSNRGRWLSRDPIEEKGGSNLYAFCHNSPSRFIDPLGDQPQAPDYVSFDQQNVQIGTGGHARTTPGDWEVKLKGGACPGPPAPDCLFYFKVDSKRLTIHYSGWNNHEQQHINDWVAQFGAWIADIEGLGKCDCRNRIDCRAKIAQSAELKRMYWLKGAQLADELDLDMRPGLPPGNHSSPVALQDMREHLENVKRQIRDLENDIKEMKQKCDQLPCP